MHPSMLFRGGGGEAAKNAANLTGELIVSAVVAEEETRLQSTPSTVLEDDGVDLVVGIVVAIGDVNDGFPVDLVMQDENVYKVQELCLILQWHFLVLSDFLAKFMDPGGHG